MRIYTLLALTLVAGGCNGEIDTGQPDIPGYHGRTVGGTTGTGTTPGGGTVDMGVVKPACPTGEHVEAGGKCCADGTHLAGTICLANEVTCAAEFPCPTGEDCVGGRCVGTPGPCMTDNDCPTGFQCDSGNCDPVCVNGNSMCKKDADCGAGSVCIACACVSVNQCSKPTPDISGLWNANQDLHLDEALGSFGQSFATILKDLRDGILGCPSGSGSNCIIFEVIASILPDYARTLIVAIGNLFDILDNHDFLITSQMTFKKNMKPSGYDGTDHWLLLTFSYQNMVISEKPEDMPQIGKPVIVDFEASTVCGILYIDKHKIEGVLSGILEWIVDTVIEVETCSGSGPCYHSLSDAISGAIDCSALGFNLVAQIACQSFTSGLSQTIDDALNSWLINYALMTLAGTAEVDPGGKLLKNGQWDGTLGDGIGIFKPFKGEWSAKR